MQIDVSDPCIDRRLEYCTIAPVAINLCTSRKWESVTWSWSFETADLDEIFSAHHKSFVPRRIMSLIF